MTVSPYMAAHIIINNYNEQLTMRRYIFNNQLRRHQFLLKTDLSESKRPAANKRVSNMASTNGTMLADRARRMLKRLDELEIIRRTDKLIIIKDLDKLKEYANNYDCGVCNGN